MDMQAIIARVEAIAASAVEGVEQALHDALDSVETVLGINPGEETGDASGVAQGDVAGDVTGDAGNDSGAATQTSATGENAPTTAGAATAIATTADAPTNGDTPPAA